MMTAKDVKAWKDYTGPMKASLIDVLNERIRQDSKWGQQNHDGPFWLTILMEEVGELGEAILESRAGA